MTLRMVAAAVALALLAASCSGDDAPTGLGSDLGAAAASAAERGEVEPEAERVDEPADPVVEPTPPSPEPEATATPAPAAADPQLDLVLMWHQHQPRYPVLDGVVSRPWVRVHAAKDYVDMAEMVTEYPDVHVTFNVTPSLLLQLEDLAAGAIDAYEAHTRVAATDLTAEQRNFVGERFFDVNPLVIARFPRFAELAAKRSEVGAGSFTVDDLRDLQVLFNLAWTDPRYLAEPPLADLVTRGRSYEEADKSLVLARHRELVERTIDVHAELAAGSQVEITTTPFAHPILPLLIDTDIATVGDPTALLPRDRFREFLDADEHVQRGLATAARLLGSRPHGMWPGEGAVSDDALRIFVRNEVRWVATGEQVLARSAGLDGITRDGADTVQQAGALYRPRVVDTPDGEIAVFFRDNRLSDLIGFEYSQSDAVEAVDDLIDRLRSARDAAIAEGVDRPLVTIILDGENAWEHYPNDGIDFLEELYERLSTTEWIATTTPSRYLDAQVADIERIDSIHPGAWFSPNYATWIGEAEEAQAWDLLHRTRLALRAAERRGTVSDERLAEANEAMLFAEGSDWFWWYGADQDSGDDRFFDRAYRALLGEVYDLIDEPRPDSLAVPIVPVAPTAPDSTPPELVELVIDGRPDPGVVLGSFGAGDGTFGFVWSADALQLTTDRAEPFDLYIGGGRPVAARGTTLDGRVLGFDASVLVRWDGDRACAATRLPAIGRNDVEPACDPVTQASGDIVELAIGLEAFGALTPGDLLRLRIDGAEATPIYGVRVPDVGGFEVVATVTDPAGEGLGPGGYLPPTDGVFVDGAFDLTEFVLGETDDELVLQFAIAGPVTNPWGSPSGLALQTFDVYLDTDRDATTGSAELLPGRDATLAAGGWDVAITIEGWQSAVVTPGADGGFIEETPALAISVLPDAGRVTVRVPRSALPPLQVAETAFGVAVLSQEGFPSPGVRRVRDVGEIASQWQLGGAPPESGHTRILDWLAVEPDAQARQLGAPAMVELLAP